MTAAASRPATPGQTVGPFFGYALPYDAGPDLVPPGHPDGVRLHGVVYDGAGDPVPDALLELWQTGPDGEVVRAAGSLRRDGFTFTGWGRAATDSDGRYRFSTLAPGGPGAAPYFAITVFARGLMNRLFTRAYLPLDLDGPAAAADPLLAAVEESRRSTLVTLAEDGGFRFDIRLQGDGETVFLAYR